MPANDSPNERLSRCHDISASLGTPKNVIACSLYFTRLNLIVEDPSFNFKTNLDNPLVAAYDLVSVQPSNEKTFQTACKESEVDIIHINAEERLPYLLKNTTINCALERGVYFEVCYSSALKDSSARRNFITNVQNLVRATRGGKNVIFSSGASSPFDIRSPHDIMNLACICGMDEVMAQKAVADNCRRALLRAEARRNTFKCAMSMKTVGCNNFIKETKKRKIE